MKNKVTFYNVFIGWQKLKKYQINLDELNLNIYIKYYNEKIHCLEMTMSAKRLTSASITRVSLT